MRYYTMHLQIEKILIKIFSILRTAMLKQLVCKIGCNNYRIAPLAGCPARSRRASSNIAVYQCVHTNFITAQV